MITINNKPLLEDSIFPGGELHVRVPVLDSAANGITIKLRNATAQEMFKLALVVDALRGYYSYAKITLEIMYFPYARQDRRCKEGEAYSLRVFLRFLEMLRIDEIITADVHSSVATEISSIPIRVKSAAYIISQDNTVDELADVADVVICPDRGATARGKEVAEILDLPVAFAEKARLSIDSIVTRLCLGSEKLITGKNVLIVDDICDGGGTFLALIKLLKMHDVQKIYLYVTHGIFSRGIDILLDAGVEKIYTTDSICNLEESEYLSIIKLQD